MEASKSFKKNEKLMEEGSFFELLFKLSMPAVVVILIMIIYNMADTYFIGQTNDPNRISAISICMPVFALLSGIGTLFGIGGGTSISISLGEKNFEKIKHITAFCGIGAIAVGFVLAIVIFVFTRPICIYLGADESTIDFAVTYLQVFSLAAPFVLFAGSYGNILRSDGEAASAMLASMAGTITNIVLDAVFILGFNWDVFGAALATVIGNILSVILIFIIIYSKKQVFAPKIKNFVWDKTIIIPIITLGLPMTFSTVLNAISGVVQNKLMIAHGSIFLAAQSVAGKFGMLITMLIMGFCMGIQPAISYNFGSKNYKRMYQIFRQIMFFSVGVGIVLALIVFIFKDRAIAVFIDNEEVIAYGQIFVVASVLSGPVYGVYQACQTFLQATGKAGFAITASLLDKGIVFIPVLFILNYKFGAYGIAFSHVATMVISVLVTIILTKIWANALTHKN